MSITDLLYRWKIDPTISKNIVEWRIQSAQSGTFEPFPLDLHPKLMKALLRLGYHALFSHQLTAWNDIKNGKNVVVTTGTGSGKTLCYNLPVLDCILREPNTRALYLFPTKALTQDQFNTLNKFDLGIKTGIYDGDTPQRERTKIRKDSNIILTNPDMLHVSILPQHTYWVDFFNKLRFVIVDEIHTYRGVFGSHVANVIRRLKRIANFHGSFPLFILTSATIANPVQFSEKLIGEEVRLIEGDYASHGERHFIIYNPPMIDPSLGIRRSSITESIRLAENLFSLGIQTIVFCTTRRTVELILRTLLENLNLTKHQKDSTIPIRGYRSGYLPPQRREIEKGLRERTIRTVIATNALELGIDIGNIDAVIITGYPGTIASVRQQAGRASRNTKTSVAVFIPSSNPIDQYLAHHPKYLLDRSPECVLINPDNPLIFIEHLRCACFEIPLSQNENFGLISNDLLLDYLNILTRTGELQYSRGKYYWIGNHSPARLVSLRNTSPDRVKLFTFENEREIVLGEIDIESASWMVHPQAIYLHDAKTYFVESLEIENRIANLRQVDVDYYTQPIINTEIKSTAIYSTSNVHGAMKFFGDIIVTNQVIGFKKIKWATNETLEEIRLELPPTQLQTMGYWFSLENHVIDHLRTQGLWKSDPIQYGPNWKTQRQRARERDRFRCRICGIPEQVHSHDVHHIKPFRTFPSYKEANELSNLITLCPNCHQCTEEAVKIRSGLAGLAYSIRNLAPLFLMCDFHDVASHFDPKSLLAGGNPTIVIYEMIPFGVGFSEILYNRHEELIHQCYDLIRECECNDGCPTCVGPGGEFGLGSKKETLAILEAMLNSTSLG